VSTPCSSVSVKRSTGHTHTPTENNTPDTDTRTHDKNNTPNSRTNTSHKDLTTLEGGACFREQAVVAAVEKEETPFSFSLCISHVIQLTPQQQSAESRFFCSCEQAVVAAVEKEEARLGERKERHARQWVHP